jgi:Ni,Fe-hydrogenase I large subunit
MLTSSTGGIGPTALLNNVIEDTTWSYYSNTADGLQPLVGETTPAVSKVNNGTQYSWLKAPRYGASRVVCEVGPLPRVFISYQAAVARGTAAQVPNTGAGQAFTLFALPANYSITDMVGGILGLGVPVAGLFSVLGRHACRAFECKLVADAMSAQAALLSANLSGNTYVYAKLPVKPKQGSGWAEAPRGALGHWCAIEKKKLIQYQCVVPSTWNHSPKDANGINGAAETVVKQITGLTGGAIATDGDILKILRFLHPFDFCIACAVHVVNPDGKTLAKFKTDLDGKVTKLPLDAEI